MTAARPLLLMLGLSCSTACKRVQPIEDVPAIIERVRAAIGRIRSYRVKLRSSYAGRDQPAVDLLLGGPEVPSAGNERVTVSSELTVRLPDRMRAHLSMGNGAGRTEMTLAFDGKTAWVAIRRRRQTRARSQPTSDQTKTLRLDQKKLAPRGAPFDVAYNVRGHGLAAGQDLVGTLQRLLSSYSFAPKAKRQRVGKEQCIVLTGRMSDERAVKEMVDPNAIGGLLALFSPREPPAQLLAGMVERIHASRTIRIWVSTRDHLPRKWVIGGDSGPPLIAVTVERFELGVKPTRGTFALRPSQRADVVDFTDNMLRIRGMAAEALKDKALINRVEQALRRRLAPAANKPSAPRRSP